MHGNNECTQLVNDTVRMRDSFPGIFREIWAIYYTQRHYSLMPNLSYSPFGGDVINKQNFSTFLLVCHYKERGVSLGG